MGRAFARLWAHSVLRRWRVRRPRRAADPSGGRERDPPKKIFGQKFFFLKNFPRSCHCGRRPPGGARGGGEGPPQKKILSKIFFFSKTFPEAATAAAGRQEVLGGGEGGTPPQKKFLSKIFFSQKLSQKLPLRPQAARGCSGRGREIPSVQLTFASAFGLAPNGFRSGSAAGSIGLLNSRLAPAVPALSGLFSQSNRRSTAWSSIAENLKPVQSVHASAKSTNSVDNFHSSLNAGSEGVIIRT